MLKYSKDGKVVFDPEDHTYTYLPTNTKLESVTTYIKRHCEQFDAPVQAKKYAEKRGLNAQEVLSSWEAKGLESRTMGTAVHLVFENYANGKGIVLSGKYPKELVAKKVIEEYFLTGRLTPVECELVLYNIEMNLAGQVDMIAQNGRGQYFMLDWKTNEEVRKDNWRRFLYPPYQHIPDADYYKYSLQLRLYQEMCSLPLAGSFIVHIGEKNYSFIKPHKINQVCI